MPDHCPVQEGGCSMKSILIFGKDIDDYLVFSQSVSRVTRVEFCLLSLDRNDVDKLAIRHAEARGFPVTRMKSLKEGLNLADGVILFSKKKKGSIISLLRDVIALRKPFVLFTHKVGGYDISDQRSFPPLSEPGCGDFVPISLGFGYCDTIKLHVYLDPEISQLACDHCVSKLDSRKQLDLKRVEVLPNSVLKLKNNLKPLALVLEDRAIDLTSSKDLPEIIDPPQERQECKIQDKGPEATNPEAKPPSKPSKKKAGLMDFF